MSTASYHLERLHALRATVKPESGPRRENVVSRFLVDPVESPQAVAVAEPPAVGEQSVATGRPVAPTHPTTRAPQPEQTPRSVGQLLSESAPAGSVKSRGYVSLRDSLGAGPERPARHPAVGGGWVTAYLKMIRKRG
jgi:hypothetical protein